MSEKELVFTCDKYTAQTARLYCWLLCAKRMGLIRDMRLYIARFLMSVEPIVYEPGDSLLTNWGRGFDLVVNFNSFFDSYGLHQIWQQSIDDTIRGGKRGHIPCPKCRVPTLLMDCKSVANGLDYKTCECKCFRHGVFTFVRP